MSLELLRLLESNARESSAVDRECVRVGPFLALIEPKDPMIWINHAVPVGPLGDPDAAVAAVGELRRVFADRNRRLRFEYFEALWPDLPGILERAGLVEQARQPLMACDRGELREPTPKVRVTVRRVAADAPVETLLAVRDVHARGFGETLSPFDEADARARLADGRHWTVLAETDGNSVGAAMLTPPPGGKVTEMVGVATVPEARRKGVAAAACAKLCRMWFDSGGETVWLSAGDEAARSLYASLGFRDIGTLLNHIDPPWPPAP